MRQGEVLSPESAVVTPKAADKAFISTTKIGEAVRKAMRKSGNPNRPYVLRSYFATQMMMAEAKGLIPYRFLSSHHSSGLGERAKLCSQVRRER